MIDPYSAHAALLLMIKKDLGQDAMTAVAKALENAYQQGKLDALKDELAKKTANKEW